MFGRRSGFPNRAWDATTLVVPEVEGDEQRQQREPEQRDRPLEAHDRLRRKTTRAQPVTGGRQHDVPDACRGERLGDLRSPGRCGGERSLSLRLACRRRAAGLGVHEPEQPDVRELLLARVANLDRDDVVVPGELEQRAPPTRGPRKSETTTTNDF